MKKRKTNSVKGDKLFIADVLAQMAILLELTGANPFKVRAYEKASRILPEIGDEFDALVESGKLTEIDGIGENLSAHITELYNTGSLGAFEELKTEVPIGVLGMIRIQGLGPKRIHRIWKELGITSVGELETACKRRLLEKVDGFGAKTEQNIIEGILFLKKFAEKRLLPEAMQDAFKLLDEIKSWKETDDAQVAGSIRRLKELIGDIDIIVATNKPKEVMNKFVALPEAEKVLQHGDTKSEIILSNGMQCDIRAVSKTQYPFALHHFTGSKEHNVKMRSIAKERGMKLNEYGLFKGASKKSVICKSEADLFKALGMKYIEPELREDMGEIEAAQSNKLPKLVERKDLLGIFHTHTTYSDGTASIEEMALEAKQLGYKYIVIADHSKAVAIARGMKPADVKRQHAEIDKLNDKIKNFRIIKGVEVDIMADGSLDFEDKVLEKFEFVIASIHSKFSMSEDDMTARIVKALKHPLVDGLAHPTGRLLLARDAYRVRLEEVIDLAAVYKKTLEINGHQQRLDLDWRWAKKAKAKGVKFFLGSDAHSLEGIHNIEFALWTARKGWLEPSDILNCMTASKLLK